MLDNNINVAQHAMRISRCLDSEKAIRPDEIGFFGRGEIIIIQAT